MRRRNGTGQITSWGYFRLGVGGNRKDEHTIVVERAIGKPLPKGAIIHHVDRVKTNNAPSNLVVCPNQAYHKLLHQRTEALEACGHADWRKCWLCKRYDAPANLYIGVRKVHHKECENARQRAQARRKRDLQLQTSA